MSHRLPINSDCYLTWFLEDPNLILVSASATITLAGNPKITVDTNGNKLEILIDPVRIRLKIDKGQIMCKGNATFEVYATDEFGNSAKRGINPDVVNFW